MKQYIGSQQAFEDQVNDHYDEIERMNKEQERQIEREVYKQMESDYLSQIQYEADKINII